MKEALYFKSSDGNVECGLCPHNCKIADGKKGRCGVRVNRGGRLYSEIYNRATSIALDPIEKKPLYHYHRGEYILSIGTKGCNLTCPWCQNWTISQDLDTPTREVSTEAIIDKAKKVGSFGIAYTYNEPFIWYEFVLECCGKAKKSGLENVFVTNGYINSEPFKEILPYIGAMNVDVKSIEESFYVKYCLGRLQPVLDNIITAKQGGVHIEITNLVIPGLNDSEDCFTRLADWVADNLGEDTPLHFSRYFPCFKMTSAPTPVSTLSLAKEIAKRKLKYVYLGNV
ncbi:MAG: AmmeMemoRadiSam system radical SAM enzyme [Candidatus Omnitrophica bacterium]|nr:AmmeMemoRadiSam system radical SAM enzyme [Candidatus Omnitrophota bacterium]